MYEDKQQIISEEETQNNRMEEGSVHLDEVLSKFGAFGRYQVKMILLLGFAFFNNGMHCINFIFVAEEVPYRCEIESCEAEAKVFDSPWYNFTATNDYRNCFKYQYTNSAVCSQFSFNTSAIVPCTEWVYSSNNSFVAEFNLACDEWKRTFVGTVHSVGLMLGLFLQGQLSDKIGRKAAIIIGGLAAALFGFAKSFANSYELFIILELLEATFGDNCSPAYIMSVELVNSDHRLQQQIFLSIIYAMGGVTLAVSAYFFPYWRQFVRAIYAPSLLFLLYFLVMDESVRWLLSKGKKERATKILAKIAKTNSVQIDEKLIFNLQCEERSMQKSPLWDTFRSKTVVKRFIICLVWWASCTFICFGLMVNVETLAGNKYINFGLMSLSDIPSSFAMVYTLKRFRRKKPLFTSFIVAGVLCLAQPFVPKKYIWMSTGLYLLGKFVSTFTFATVYMYTSELFPTYTRNSMHALCSAIGRIGSILAPMTPLLTKYMESLPTFLIAAISIFAGLLTLLVPDLADEPLPDNVKQAELIGICHRNKIPDVKDNKVVIHK